MASFFITLFPVTLNYLLQRLGMLWWSILPNRGLKCDSSVLLHLFRQFLDHLLLLERSLIEPVMVRGGVWHKAVAFLAHDEVVHLVDGLMLDLASVDAHALPLELSLGELLVPGWRIQCA